MENKQSTFVAMESEQPTFVSMEIEQPTFAAFLVGDSIGFVPKPWPKAKFKEALVDTVKDFGNSWVFCECVELSATEKIDAEKPDDQRLLAVTKLAMDARKEYLQMNKAKSEEDENTTSGEDLNVFCLIGVTDKEEGPIILPDKRKLSQNLTELKHVPQDKDKNVVSENMLHLEEKVANTIISPLKLNEKSGKEFKMKIPTIVIVVEGDLDTINHVAKTVKKNIPVLLVRGSGMAADLIGYCLSDEGALKTRAPLLFGICFTKENFKSLEEDIETIRNNGSKISEFDINTESVTSLKDRVTESIIRTWAMSSVEGGATAAAFTDRPDPSDTEPTALTNVDDVKSSKVIKSTNNITRRTSKIIPICDEAVRTGSGNPVTRARNTGQSEQLINYLPMPSDVDVPAAAVYNPPVSSKVFQPSSAPVSGKAFHQSPPPVFGKVSPIALHMLYQMLQFNPTPVNEENELGRDLLLYALQENLCDIAEVLVDKGVTLKFSLAKDLYKKTQQCIADIIELPVDVDFPKKRKEALDFGCSIIHYKIAVDEKWKHGENDGMEPSDLLLWAVLTNNMKLAEIFWKRSPEPILTALAASAILRKMSRRAHWKKEAEFERTMKEHSSVFSQRAIDVSQSLFENNTGDAFVVLQTERSTPVWGIKDSCLEFALVHKIYNFVSHHVPQKCFDRIMFGGQLESQGDDRSGCPVPCKSFRMPLIDLLTCPYLKFVVHYVIFSLFLVCLSAFIMTNIGPQKWPIDKENVYEYCAYIWLFADIIEEYVPPAFYTIRQFLNPNQWRRRAWNHMHNFWNGMDFLSYSVLITGICVRFGYETTDFGISRRIYSVGLFLMYMRSLHVLLIARWTGPTVIMLKEGLKELMRFVVIITVLVISVGVFYHANLYPNHYDMFSPFGINHWSVWKIIKYPYWSIYGEFADEIGGKDSTDQCSNITDIYRNNPDIERCPESDWMVALMSGFFILILNLLLVNLIIAMFSFRFEEIKNNSDQFCRFHRSQVTMEFRRRIPVPFNLLVRPIKMVIYCFLYCKNYCEEKKGATEKNTVEKTREILDEKQQILAGRWMLSDGEQDAKIVQWNGKEI